MDYATLENVEVEPEQSDGQSSPPIKQSSSAPYSLKLLMRRNSEGRAEQIVLAAETQSVPWAFISFNVRSAGNGSLCWLLAKLQISNLRWEHSFSFCYSYAYKAWAEYQYELYMSFLMRFL